MYFTADPSSLRATEAGWDGKYFHGLSTINFSARSKALNWRNIENVE
jgi:hypothetical protein